MFEGSFAQIRRESQGEGVADTQTHQQLETECLPTAPPRKGPQLEVLSSLCCCRMWKMHDAQSLGASSLSFPFCFPACIFNPTLGIAFRSVFRGVSSQSTHPRAHRASYSSALINRYRPRHTLAYADAHAYSANVCASSASLWLITVCSPPQMLAQDQETTVRLLTSSSSSSVPTPHVLLFNVFLCFHCLPPLKQCLQPSRI